MSKQSKVASPRSAERLQLSKSGTANGAIAPTSIRIPFTSFTITASAKISPTENLAVFPPCLFFRGSNTVRQYRNACEERLSVLFT